MDEEGVMNRVQGSGDAIVLSGSDGAYYAVPQQVIDRRRVSPERRTVLLAHLQAQIAGDATRLPVIPDEMRVAELTADELASYRLSEEQAAPMLTAAGDADVRGYFSVIPATSQPWHTSMLSAAASPNGSGSDGLLLTSGFWVNPGSGGVVVYAPPQAYHKGRPL
jgi:hypothetical protein